MLVAAPAPRRRRARSQLAGGGLDALVGAGGPADVHGGEFVEPVAFQAVDQPPQPEDSFGQGGVGQAGQVVGGQLIDRRGQSG
jgi:hypothetical protein